MVEPGIDKLSANSIKVIAIRAADFDKVAVEAATNRHIKVMRIAPPIHCK
jgi:lactate dehydrogenase-like 2-hydroxyacid dehydrogenase